MALTDTAIKNIKPNDKAIKLFDSAGLFLYVTSKGGKLWRLKYRFEGKEKLLSFGAYPTISLKEARKRREEAKELLAQGVDPSEAKKQAKIAIITAQQEAENTFKTVALEWYQKYSVTLEAKHQKKILSRLEKMLFPYLGSIPIHKMETPDLLKPIRIVEEAGKIETAHRLVQLCSQVFRYAVITKKAKHDIAVDLRGALQSKQVTHRACITEPSKLGELLRCIDTYDGTFQVIYALKIAPYVFVRPSELRCAEWSEINFETAEWRIPSKRMKMKQMHIVPLSKQVVSLLRELFTFSGHEKLLFYGLRSTLRPISDMALNNALRSMGFSGEEMCTHGFRGTASTMLNEMGYNFDHIERQLAHCERNAVRKAYNHAEYLPERKKMMQEWADYLDGLKR
ncbi:tyrosine-type recombinase/integrase [Desulfovibrio litoralis]|uniref:Integrase n=1 Tax=Desulfovibrio litoralis DSM 11393 TaxID=1121455 RepID=A0A1M7TKY2_9BACT|nr:integrase arm-type DNA-binding domain-containing protein [Desulfovibrio litoralis]SHN71399.1 Integrase [Desulfovibrio litoralis DSM 11393]